MTVLLAACGGDSPAPSASNPEATPTVQPAGQTEPDTDGSGLDEGATAEATDDGQASPSPQSPAPTASPATAPTPVSPTPTAPPPLQGLETELVVGGLDQPVLVTGAPGTDALFVVEREGVVRLVADGAVAPAPFLDLRDQLLSSSIEQGLLGLAFAPDYADTGRFFAYWTMTNGDSRLAEFTATDPTTVDADTMQVLLDVEQPAERHNAGMIVIGPDGFLYLALGDGGSGGTTAQDTNNLLGSIVRLDVTASGTYEVPGGNPYGNEIWVNGLRNPWRFSIDPVDEFLYVGDVGQDTFEEVNVVGLDGAGTNFGWLQMEGDQCFSADCDPSGLTTPVVQYTHAEGCSVTGGHVYRGPAIPELTGHYLYADWCTGFVRSFRYVDGEATEERDWSGDLFDIGQVTSFGVDNSGELYATNWAGQVLKIVPRR
ncbi:MAG: PQQ-dependent sugar dehydrogenase [Acidimicrobiales bacterium]